jgi:FMN phosphatase YigB (HAD superfamily)
MITAALFDWDLTLAAVMGEAPWNVRISMLFRMLDYDHDPDAVQAALDRYAAERDPAGQLDQMLPQTFDGWADLYCRLLSILGRGELPRAVGERLARDYGRLPFQLYHDAAATLDALRARGLALGIITNAPVGMRPTIEALAGAWVCPEHIVISDEVGAYKPDATIFVQAAARLGAAPGACLFVGDNPEVDALGAVRAGYARGLWIARNGAGAPPPGVACIKGLGELLEYV